MQQEMHCFDARYFEPLYLLAIIFRPKKAFDDGYRQERAEPFVFVIIPDEEAHVAIAGLVSRAAKYSQA